MQKKVNNHVKKEFLIAFGKHLKELRISKGFSQTELGKRCNADAAKVSKTERGIYDFKISSLLVVAKGLDISLTELFNFTEIDNYTFSIFNET